MRQVRSSQPRLGNRQPTHAAAHFPVTGELGSVSGCLSYKELSRGYLCHMLSRHCSSCTLSCRQRYSNAYL